MTETTTFAPNGQKFYGLLTTMDSRAVSGLFMRIYSPMSGSMMKPLAVITAQYLRHVLYRLYKLYTMYILCYTICFLESHDYLADAD